MSNRLTFSLASLILIFALAAMPVMAHDTAPKVDGVQHGPADADPPGTIGTHTHDTAPTVASIELVDVMARAAGSTNTADPTSSTVRGNVVQLVTTVTDANPIRPAADAAGEFLVKITFSEDVYDGSSTAIPADDLAATAADLVAAELTVTASEEGGGANLFGPSEITIGSIVHQAVGGGSVTIPNPDGTGGTLTVVAADATPGTGEIAEDLKVFYVTFAVAGALFTGADLPINVWVNVNEDAVYTRTALNAQGETVYGEGNDESDREKFTIDSALEAIPVKATPSAATVNGSTDIVVTLSATVTIPSLVASDFTVMEGDDELTPVWDGTAKTLTITPAGTGDTTVTVAPFTPSTAGAKKISFDKVEVTVDRTAPGVTLGGPTPAAPMAGDEVTVTISVDDAVDETVGRTDIALTEISVTQDASGTESILVHGYNATSGAVTFTPSAASTVTVTVDAGAVMDDVGNSSAEVTKPITVTVPDDPVAVTATAAAATVNGSTDIVVTLSATDPATVPTDLMASDFDVMEGTTALTPVWDGTANTLTIKPNPAGTGDTTVTVDPSPAGKEKISFDEVEVMVDRTGPIVEIGSVMPAAPMVGDEVTVTVSVAADATQGAVALEHITATQTATDGTQSNLDREYNVNNNQVTFMPTAAGTVTVTVAADAVMDAVDNSNAAASSAAITVAPARVAVAVTATAAAATVNGSTDIVVTLSATDPATVPTDLMASDFDVMEGTDALTLAADAWDNTAKTLTITPAGTGDTTVTVEPSEAGGTKITFTAVSVMVDRTGPMVVFSDVTGAKADTAVMVTITVTGADTGETIAVGDIGVVQTLSDGTAKVLEHTYNAGAVTFTPDAMSTVVVSVDADAVMDAVGNGNAEKSSSIKVAAADFVDATAPTVTVAAGTQSGRTLPVTFTVADETALGTGTGDATLEAAEITVTGGTLGTLTASTATAGEYTADITINYAVTTVTVAVAAGAVKDAAATPNSSAAVSMDFTVTATSAPPATLPDGTFKIPAKSHIIVGHDEGTMGLPASITPMTWTAMPDLENLLFTGGTVLLTTDKTTMLDRDGKADTAAEAAKKRDALITEVMAAVNTAAVGQTGYTAHQWIELYNNLPVEITVKLSTKEGRPASDAGADEIRLDRLSNQVGAGWEFKDLGQNGSDDGVATTADVDFISFYRKERGGDKDGHVLGHWMTSTDYYLAGHKGTPGAKERSTAVTVSPTEFDVGGLIFNEISNRKNADKAYEWIELRNKSGGEINPKKWRISIVTAVGSDVNFFTFPDNDNAKIAAGGLLLLVKSDPSGDPNHPLAAGWNVAKNAANQVNGVNSSSPRYLVADFAGDGLPDDGEFVLILRNTNDDGKLKKPENLIDIAGYSTKLKVADAGFTNLWPLKGGVRSAELGNNKLAVSEVHRRQKDNIWGTSSTNYGRNGGNHHDDTAWRNDGWTGIGYKRNAAANNVNGGTPGYQHGTLKSEGIAQGSQVIISEIMFDASRNLPQWIELQNLSTSTGVNIDNWSIFVVNHNLNVDGSDYNAGKLSERIDLDGRIPPGQTFLIVSTSNRSDTQLPAERIHNLRRGRGETLLNPNGFRIQLKAKTNEGDANKHQLVDDVGNLPDKPAASRRADAQSFMEPVWNLPSGMTEDGDRVSIARKTTKATNAQGHRTELLDLKKTGVNEGGWIRSDEDARLSRMHSSTYYGHASDIASPGQTVGSILPVSLSKFRPERLDNGSIRIVWITESELNNAGFNILRSEKRDGEFKQINTKLIAGQGTTSERTTYTYTDPSAKPNVVYYYQIQDVSLDGQVQTLRTTHLRGNVTAVGKATTTWGELKALQ